MKLNFKEIVDQTTGELIVSIGQGKFRETVAIILLRFERQLEEAQKEGK